MIIKVCGMRDKQNMLSLLQLKPDWMGMIFYERSSRNVKQQYGLMDYKYVKKVGVFVDESPFTVGEKILNFGLDILQFHGNETPEFCMQFSDEDIEMIKAFSVSKNFDFDNCEAYEGKVNYFLFDAKGEMPGGNGVKYNWDKLNEYKGSTPFLLSGGIRLEDIEAIKEFNHPMCIGIDINSGFETQPGIKNVEQIKLFMNQLKTNE